MPRKNTAEKLQTIRSGILGVTNTPEIQRLMAALGYTPERIAEGMRMLEEAEQIVALNVEYYSDQYTSTSELNIKWSEAYSVYMITLKVVRVALKGQVDKLARFKANGERRRSLSGWIEDANVFYTNLLFLKAVHCKDVLLQSHLVFLLVNVQSYNQKVSKFQLLLEY